MHEATIRTVNQEIFIQDFFFVFVIFTGFFVLEANVKMHFQVSNFSCFFWIATKIT